MYYFEATFTNMDSGTIRVEKIEIEEQFFVNEFHVYIAAMSRAYNMKKENECLANVEFIAC